MVLKSSKSNLKITEQHLLTSASANSACITLKLETKVLYACTFMYLTVQ